MWTGNCRVGEKEAELYSAAGKGRVMQVSAWESAWNRPLIIKESRPQQRSCSCLIPESITHAFLKAGWRENNRLVLVKRDVIDTIKTPEVGHPGWVWTWSFLWFDRFWELKAFSWVSKCCVCVWMFLRGRQLSSPSFRFALPCLGQVTVLQAALSNLLS